ncbi:MAG: type II secretion system minor pseudopilin GspK [Steroidobacteraceae bacterium]
MGAVPLRRPQRGVALLVAILLVALGTIIAAAMAYDNAMTARRAAATFEFDQALLVTEGAEALAAYGLQQQFQQHAPYISPSQSWGQPLPPQQVMPGVTLQASLEDLQGRFNINSLVEQNGLSPNTPAIQAFQQLLTMLGLDPKFADDLVNWIDKNPTPVFPDAATDSVYLEMAPPYRTAEMPITSTSELMALPGFTRADFDRLAPFIVALPLSPATTINVCSASPWLLDALTGVKQFSVDPAAFEKQRQESGACFPPNFLNTVDPALRQQLTGMVGQTSSWFRLTTFVSLGSTEFAVYTLLFVDPTGQVRPVMRSFTPN